MVKQTQHMLTEKSNVFCENGPLEIFIGGPETNIQTGPILSDLFTQHKFVCLMNCQNQICRNCAVDL